MHHGQLPCQRQNRALTGCVRQLRSGRTDKTDHAGGVDDARLCLSVLAEAQNCVFAAEPYTLDVNGLCQIPDLLWGVDGIVVIGVHYAGIVEDDVQTAPGVDVGYNGFNVRFLGNIADLGLDLEAFGGGNYFMELGQGLLERWCGNVGEENIGALTCKKNGCLEADAAVRC